MKVYVVGSFPLALKVVACYEIQKSAKLRKMFAQDSTISISYTAVANIRVT